MKAHHSFLHWPRAVACLGLLALGLSAPALAAPCRDIATVQQSANADQNTAMGGHVTQHIYGMTPPAGSSQLGKTLFEARGKYDAAWRQYQYISNPIACSGNAPFQVVSLTALGMGNLGAYSCTQADAQGRCTKWDSYMAKEISFGFILRNGQWIVNTIYPVALN